MFNLKDAITDISLQDILSKITEYDIWKRYCTNFEEINKPFLSELYDDRNPSCRIYQASFNKLTYKDFGTGDTYSCFDYICKKYGCNFKESLKVIYNDFKLGSIKVDIIPQLVLNNASEGLKIPNKKSSIEIVPQPWTYTDYKYWSDYEIPFELLDEYNVFSCERVYLHTKSGKTLEYVYRNDNPIYAYRFCFDGKYSYKIYFPLADKKHKWLFSGGSENDIEGYDQLPYHGDTLILTKSLKDCMCYNLIGLPAISLQGETNKLKQELVTKLYKRFNRIIVCYDNDEEGIRGSKRLKQQYNFDYFFIEEEKDLSDFVKLYGLNSAKEMINNKLKEI